MIIKYNALPLHLKKKTQPLYVITGSDPFLLNDACLNIKKSWFNQGETDEKRLDLSTNPDWSLLAQEANSYSLFAFQTLLDLRLEKKSIDKAGVDAIKSYLASENPRCLVILQAFDVPLKQLQWLDAFSTAIVVHIPQQTEAQSKQWIKSRLQQHSIPHEQSLPEVIYQYTQGNSLAAAQLIEKLSLTDDKTTTITSTTIKAHLIDQCEFQLYDLADACLLANAPKALHILRQALQTRTEPTLLLWLLTQEIRQLINLSYLLKAAINFTDACNKLKIWSSRARSYQTTLSRLSLQDLHQLLHRAKAIDEFIKTSQTQRVWHGLDNIVISLCIGSSK